MNESNPPGFSLRDLEPGEVQTSQMRTFTGHQPTAG